MTKTLLVVHPSSGLYGADRSLLSVLERVVQAKWHCIVCLPEHGPLEEFLKNIGCDVHVTPFAVVRRAMFTPLQILRLPFALVTSMRELERIVAGRHVDLVYTNTLAVLAAAFWAWRRRIKHIWHVREIIQSPFIVRQFYRLVTPALSARLICNSQATRKWLVPKKNKNDPVDTIWNGTSTVELVENDVRESARVTLGCEPGTPLILMVGRINASKGQDLLIEAVNLLHCRGTQGFQVVIVGGPVPGKTDLVDLLKRLAEVSPMAHRISVFPFEEHINRFYTAADIVVVPSRLPESFGRVAIEAMAAGIPVVAAAHGGLREIIVDKETGRFFPPNDAEALANALAELIEDAARRRKLGTAGRQRQQQLFSLESYQNSVFTVLESEAM